MNFCEMKTLIFDPNFTEVLKSPIAKSVNDWSDRIMLKRYQAIVGASVNQDV